MMALNSALFANPQLFQAYQSDPRLGYAQALMQQGASAAPVRSPLEGLARAAQGAVGGFLAGRTRHDYQDQGEKYRKGLAAALQNGDVLAALTASDDPQLQQMGLQAKLQQQLDPAKDPLVKVFDPNTHAEVWRPQSQAGGMQASAPQLPEAPETRQVGDGKGGLIDEQWNATTGQWEKVGSRAQFAPQQPQERWRTVTDESGKPLYQESSLGQRKALPGQEGAKPPSAADLRGEYTKGLKEYNEALNGFNKVAAAASDTSPAGDLAMIFGFMKTLDPSSTVREGEFATAQNAGSVPTQIQSLYNRIISGERLTPEQRADFVNTAKGQFGTYQERKKLADEYYGGLARKYGIDPNEVLVPFPNAASVPGGTEVYDEQGNLVQ